MVGGVGVDPPTTTHVLYLPTPRVLPAPHLPGNTSPHQTEPEPQILKPLCEPKIRGVNFKGLFPNFSGFEVTCGSWGAVWRIV